MAHVVPATTAQTAEVQRHWRAQADPELTSTAVPGSAEHAFVIFDKMFTEGINLQGTELQRSPQAAQARRTARQTGTLAVSPTYQLLSDQQIPPADRQTSVVLAAPVATGLGNAEPDVFKGWIILGLHGEDFLAATLLAHTRSAVQITLTDPSGASPGIADIQPDVRAEDTTLVRQHIMVVGQRRWLITLWPATRLLDAADRGVSSGSPPYPGAR